MTSLPSSVDRRDLNSLVLSAPGSPTRTLPIARRGRCDSSLVKKMREARITPPSFCPRKSSVKLPGAPLSPSKKHSPNRQTTRKRLQKTATKVSCPNSLSPETLKAASAISELNKTPVRKKSLQETTARRLLTFKENTDRIRIPGAQRALELTLNPAMGDTRVYPLDSEDYQKREKAVREIKRIEAVGLGFVSPLELAIEGEVPVPTFQSYTSNRKFSDPRLPKMKAEEEMKPYIEACRQRLLNVQRDAWTQ